MKQALDIYFDMTVRKIVTLIEIVLLIAVIYITAFDTISLPLAAAIITFLILMIIDHVITFFYQFNSMRNKPIRHSVAAHVLQCYISPTFRTPRRIAGLLFTIYALILIAGQEADLVVKAITTAIAALLLTSHVLGLYLSFTIYNPDAKKQF